MTEQSQVQNTSKPWAEAYRNRWKWDSTAWGTHCVDCYPSNCPYRVYVKDGRVVREEPGATYQVVEDGVPDMNPSGCQKGASWSQLLDGKERVLHPLRRAGERGEGKWEQVSWDEALTDIADAMLDAIQESGPESIVRIGTPGQGGTQSITLAGGVLSRLGATHTDVQSEINDFNPGIYVTFGRFDPCPSNDDWFHSELLLIWANNPAYSSIPTFHYLTEARYNGSEVALIGPDYSPSAIHADHFLPVRIGTDAALALSMCRVIVDEGLVDEPFVAEQTDLGLLVRTDNGRFLRQSDLHEGGSDEIFHLFDARTGQIVEAPRTLDLGEIEPALAGTYIAILVDGTQVEVQPAFERLRERLRDYAPEDASSICGVHPDRIRELARKAASRTTRIIAGWTLGKSYHGDLMERSQCLLLALTGNWGKKGAGIRSWAVGMFDGMFLLGAKSGPGQDATREMFAGQKAMLDGVLANDSTLTPEILMAEIGYQGAESAVGGLPSAVFWYNHCGYREAWNTASWNDPTMPRTFDEYVNEAIEKGWWPGRDKQSPDKPPRVLFEIGGNMLRRQRGGQRMLLENLWPKLKMIVSIDCRITTTGLHSDIILPAAQHYEKPNFPYTTPDIMTLTLSDRAVEPAGESASEWQINQALAKKVAERAKAREFVEMPLAGGTVRLDTLYEDITMNGALADDDAVIDEMIRDSAVLGNIPADTTLASLRETGYVRFTDWGRSPMALAQASDLKPDETHSPFRWQTEKKEPFPTLTRRAQFYIDHEWFLEAGEELPVHKEPPAHGGDYPLQITSGHPRWSVNSTNTTSSIILGTLRGEPVVHINDRDAAARGIKNGQDIRVFNDCSSITVQARVTPAVQPGQVISYNGWEPYQYKEWKDMSNVEPGMVKWLHLAGGYGHLRYRALHWQPVPIDRGVRVDVAAV